MTNEEYVYCAVCGSLYKGKIPRGGDGSIIFPRKHNRYVNIPHVNPLGITIFYQRKEVCPGSYQEAIEQTPPKIVRYHK